MKELLDLFWAFCRIGGLTFGGGYAMLPMLQAEVVDKYKWATEEELLDYYACALIHPTAKLEEFVSNKFKIKQDKQFLRTIWAARISIATALIVGFKDELLDLLTSIIN